MATHTLDITPAQAGWRGKFAAFFNGLAEGYEAYAHAHSRVNLIQKLEAKSDAELAELGIKRADIVRHVFRDLYYV